MSAWSHIHKLPTQFTQNSLKQPFGTLWSNYQMKSSVMSLSVHKGKWSTQIITINYYEVTK